MVEQGPKVSAKKPANTTPKAAEKINLLQRIETTLKELTELFGDRLDPLFKNSDDVADPPTAVRDFIRRLNESETLGNDLLGKSSSRTQERVTCFTVATVVPVDRHWNPIQEPFKVAIRDISESGIRMLHTRSSKCRVCCPVMACHAACEEQATSRSTSCPLQALRTLL